MNGRTRILPLTRTGAMPWLPLPTTEKRMAATIKGRTVLVTGATDGIGKQTAHDLAALGAKVILHGRNGAKVKAAADDVKKAIPDAEIDTAVADLASLADVKRMAGDVEKRFPALSILINNAGVFMHDRVLTSDGFETTFAVNHLAPFVLTELLLPTLKRNAPSRIINVSSMAHSRGRWDPANLQGEKSFDGYAAYALSKLCNVLHAQALSTRIAGSGVTINALHPGVIKTKLLRDGFGSNGGGSLKSGAATSVYVASSDDVKDVSGKYFSDSRIARGVEDPRAAEELFERSLKLAGL